MQIKMRVREVGKSSWVDRFSTLYSKKFELILVTIIISLLLILSLSVEYLLQSKLALSMNVSIGASCAIFFIVLITAKLKLTRKVFIFLPLYILLFALFGYIYLLIYSSLPIVFISFFADMSIFVFIVVCIVPVVFVEMYRRDQSVKISKNKIDSFKQLIKRIFLSQGFSFLFTLALWLLFAGGLSARIFQKQSNDEMVAAWMFFAWIISSSIAFFVILIGMSLATRGIEKSFRLVVLFAFVTVVFIFICIIFFSFLFSVYDKLIV